MIQGRAFERRLIQIFLIFSDVVILIAAFSISQFIRFNSINFEKFVKPLVFDFRFLGVSAIVIFSSYIFDLYEPRHWRSRLFAPLKSLFANLSSILLIFAWLYILTAQTSGLLGRGVFLGAMITYFIASTLVRYFVDRKQKAMELKRRYLVLVPQKIKSHLLKDLSRLGIVDQIEFVDTTDLEFENKLRKLIKFEWSAVIVDGKFSEGSTRELMKARVSGQVVLSLQSFYEFYCGKILATTLDDSWFAFTEGFSIIHSQTSVRLKRVFDILVSIFLLILLWPIMLLCWILIRLESPGAALYSQVRVGKMGELFTIWKFRSMRLGSEASGPQFAQKNDSRVTFLGSFMRKVRLDELPQLWNILKGDMSFIGPRPERPEFIEKICLKVPFFEFRSLVKPGLTGWAQVMYPYGATDEDHLEKVQFDLYYIKNYSFELDIEIIFKTVVVVFFGAGR